MREQVVGLFTGEEGVVEASRMLHAAGYTHLDLDLVSEEEPRHPSLPSGFRHVQLGRLMERPEGMWPCGLRWALIGSIVVEVPVLIWVLLAFDSWGVQVLLASTLWKFGTLFGGMLGAIVGADRGLEAPVAHRYHKHLAQGALALAARVDHRDAPQTRGMYIESGAFDIRNVEGTFTAKESRLATRNAERRNDRSARQESIDA